jgi:hypothetical protein
MPFPLLPAQLRSVVVILSVFRCRNARHAIPRFLPPRALDTNAKPTRRPVTRALPSRRTPLSLLVPLYLCPPGLTRAFLPRYTIETRRMVEDTSQSTF